jgi:glycosyltransferase involved in cell wall biosynthesis
MPSVELKVLIFCSNSSVKYGLGKDAAILENALKERSLKSDSVKLSIMHLDPRTAQIPFADVAFHIEVPCRLAIPYCKKHYFIVNPEWFYKDEWKWALKAGTLIQRFPKALNNCDVAGAQVFTLSWRAPPVALPPVRRRTKHFVCFLGASKHKLAALLDILPLWKPEYPPLKIWCAEGIIEKLEPVVGGQKNISLSSQYVSDKDVVQILAEAEWCLLPSEAEGFGYAMMEAATAGALPLWCGVPAYCSFLDDIMGSNGQITMKAVDISGCEFLAGPMKVNSKSFEMAFALLLGLSEEEIAGIRKRLIDSVGERLSVFRQHCTILWNTMLRSLEKLPLEPGCGLPPRLLKMDEEPPKVGVVTLTYNRPHWMKLAFENILKANWPQERLVWIVADDSSFDKRVDAKISKFMDENPKLTVEYVSIPKQMFIGAKRNRAIKQALGKYTDIEYFVMMDDDDVYYPNSIRDRIAYLQSYKKSAAYCSILPMYDLNTYTSAINVPPLDLSPAKRCSEATLAFSTAFWSARGFTDKTSTAEGEGFLAGREDDTVEMSPQGIIVSLLHSQNTSSRRIRSSMNDMNMENGCHYGFKDDFFVFVHELGNESQDLVKKETALKKSVS